MALRTYQCLKCEYKTTFFDHEKVKKCDSCKSVDLKRLLGVPLSMKSTIKTDKYHDINYEVGIQEDLRKRSTRHVNDTLCDLIEEHGQKIAKEMKWLITEDGGKTWRLRNNFDTNTVGKSNSGSAEKLGKKKND